MDGTLLIVTTTTTVYSVSDNDATQDHAPVEEDRPGRLLTIDEVSGQLGVSPRWVYAQVRSGRLPAMQIARSWRVKPKAVQEFAKSFSNSGEPS